LDHSAIEASYPPALAAFMEPTYYLTRLR